MTHLKFDDDPETAALELILAQLCAAYRRRFHRGYPTEGEEDLRILYRVTEHFTVKRRVEINRLHRHWILYLDEAGPDGSVADFESWILYRKSKGKVIKFPG